MKEFLDCLNTYVSYSLVSINRRSLVFPRTITKLRKLYRRNILTFQFIHFYAPELIPLSNFNWFECLWACVKLRLAHQLSQYNLIYDHYCKRKNIFTMWTTGLQLVFHIFFPKSAQSTAHKSAMSLFLVLRDVKDISFYFFIVFAMNRSFPRRYVFSIFSREWYLRLPGALLETEVRFVWKRHFFIE